MSTGLVKVAVEGESGAESLSYYQTIIAIAVIIIAVILNAVTITGGLCCRIIFQLAPRDPAKKNKTILFLIWVARYSPSNGQQEVFWGKD